MVQPYYYYFIDLRQYLKCKDLDKWNKFDLTFNNQNIKSWMVIHTKQNTQHFQYNLHTSHQSNRQVGIDKQTVICLTVNHRLEYNTAVWQNHRPPCSTPVWQTSNCRQHTVYWYMRSNYLSDWCLLYGDLWVTVCQTDGYYMVIKE